MGVEVVGTDRVDEGSPHTPSYRRQRAGPAGARAEDLHTGGVIQTGGRVALGYVVLAEISLEPGQAGTVEGLG